MCVLHFFMMRSLIYMLEGHKDSNSFRAPVLVGVVGDDFVNECRCQVDTCKRILFAEHGLFLFFLRNLKHHVHAAQSFLGM